MWCKIFLTGKSFTSFAGSEVAFALLFPMETLFESYIAIALRKSLNCNDYSISIQDKTYHLFDEPRKFLMKPDIVIKNKRTHQSYILDTKWKLLSNDISNYGISQSDMYQMYAYQKKYKAENVTLLYPLTDKISTVDKIEFIAEDETRVLVRFVDLFDVTTTLKNIFDEITSFTH